jgi:hypothetical protein
LDSSLFFHVTWVPIFTVKRAGVYAWFLSDTFITCMPVPVLTLLLEELLEELLEDELLERELLEELEDCEELTLLAEELIILLLEPDEGHCRSRQAS